MALSLQSVRVRLTAGWSLVAAWRLFARPHPMERWWPAAGGRPGAPDRQTGGRWLVEARRRSATSRPMGRWLRAGVAPVGRSRAQRRGRFKLAVDERSAGMRCAFPAFGLSSCMKKAPLSIRWRGFFSAADCCYICSIITSPKPEHDTCVAPSIRRAKS